MQYKDNSREVVIGKDGLEFAESGKLYWLTLLENGEYGDEIIEHIYDVQENEVKYASARLVQLAQAKGIECYSIEVSSGVAS